MIWRAFSPRNECLSIKPGAAPQAEIGRTVGAGGARERLLKGCFNHETHRTHESEVRAPLDTRPSWRSAFPGVSLVTKLHFVTLLSGKLGFLVLCFSYHAAGRGWLMRPTDI